MNKTFLIIGLIWPEPETTGAGLRMMQLISMLKDLGMDLHFACTAQRTQYSAVLEDLDVTCSEIKLNHSSFDDYLKQLDPGFVMFDRFAIEEQFSWRVAQHCPDAVRILDSEDLHFLRARRGMDFEPHKKDSKPKRVREVQNRELASICRSDLTLVISEFEMNILISEFGIDPDLLFYLPFVFEKKELEHSDKADFDRREGFLFMGNWKHGPNRDAVIHLKDHIWPLIKRELPDANIYIYGAYGQKHEKELSDQGSGFHIMGWAEDKKSTYLKHRVCLAPMRYGAGLKGKLIDAMCFGMPNISSSIAAEGIAGEMDWPGFVRDDPREFAPAAVKLYSNNDLWEQARSLGFEILGKRFSRERFREELSTRLKKVSSELDSMRKRNWIGSMLWHHSLQSTKYLAKWIEAKNRN